MKDDKIFMKDKEEDESNGLSNMIIAFKPGLFLTAILVASCLILKIYQIYLQLF